jgi:hypothetical protein
VTRGPLLVGATDRRDSIMLKKIMHRRSIAQAGQNLRSYYSWFPGR